MTRTQILQLVDWKEQGKLEYRSDFGGWHGRAEFSTHEKFEDFRIKPTPTLRPWRPEEVPMLAVVREKSLSDKIAKEVITRCDSYGSVKLGDGQGGMKFYSRETLLEKYEMTLDHGKTWLPCGVVTD